MDGAVSIGGSAGGIYAEQGSETGEISTAQDALSVSFIGMIPLTNGHTCLISDIY